MTRRSLFAWRLFANYGMGDGARFHSVGGFNQIRGFEYREFFGDRVIFTNLEMRFPLVDTLGLPFGAIRNIRGVFFLDAGTAYTQDGWFFDSQTNYFRKFKWYDKDEDIFVDLRASWGLGFSFSMGAFDLTWTFAQRFPFLETHISDQCEREYNQAATGSEVVSALSLCPLEEVNDNGFHSDFYIGFPF
jgi:outer membrane protein assembly factor BamA